MDRRFLVRDGDIGAAEAERGKKVAIGLGWAREEFVEFLSNMSFRTKGSAGYIESKMLKTKAQQELKGTYSQLANSIVSHPSPFVHRM